jgi:hypothetical protein
MTGTTTRTALYRLYDAAETLLYVGISDAPAYRWSQHACEKPWWPDVARKVVEWHDSRDLAMCAESVAIRSENPIHNRTGTKPVATNDAFWSSGNPDPFDDLPGLAARLEEAKVRATDLLKLRDEAIKWSRDAGHPIPKIAEAAKVSIATVKAVLR